MKLFSVLIFVTISYSLALAQPLNGVALFNYAKENSPTIKNSSLNIQLAEQQIKQAVTSGMPKLNGDLGFQNFINIPTTVVPASAFVPGAPDDELLGLEFGTDFNANYALKLDQLLFSFSYIYGVKAAKSYSELARLLQLKQMEDLRETILLELGRYILIKKSQLLANRNKTEIETLTKNTQKLIDEGFLEKTAITDLLLMDLEMEVLKNDLLTNEKVTLINLKSTIGYPLDSSINLIDSFNITYNSLSSDSLNAKKYQCS
jgi:outer membrane protein TolC